MHKARRITILVDMRVTEVTVNQVDAVRVNDVEYREFKEACKANGVEVARTTRELMRDYVKKEKRKK